MRLLFVLAATLALSLAESEQKHYEDLEAAESIELQKTHDLDPSASAYHPVPYSSWNQPQYPQINNQQPYVPTFGSAPPAQYIPGFPPKPVQNDPPQQQTTPTPTTTTPVSVIKNEQYLGNDGSYRYEYQLADGTWVAEQGWVVPGPNGENNDVVKKGWYQYKANDGKIYTVTYWADHTGYHAFGEHLPVAPPTPPAIQASLDQNAKEEAAKAEAEKNKPYYTTTSRPVYYDPPQQPQYNPQQSQYNPQQSQYNPQQSQYIPQQQQYNPQQSQYIPQQSQYPQPQQPYYPPSQSQQPYYPPQTK